MKESKLDTFCRLFGEFIAKEYNADIDVDEEDDDNHDDRQCD